MGLRSFQFYMLHPIIFVRRLAYKIYEWRHPDDPWIAQGAVEFLNSRLNKDMKLFEWGSGRSTLWFSKRVNVVISIEYNSQWASKLAAMISDQKIENVDLRYVPLDHEHKAPTTRHYDQIPQYVAEIFKCDRESFGAIVVDGHYRLTCVDKCLDYIRSGGYLVVDNSNREPLHQWGVPPNWRVVHQSKNVMTETTIWQKP